MAHLASTCRQLALAEDGSSGIYVLVSIALAGDDSSGFHVLVSVALAEDGSSGIYVLVSIARPGTARLASSTCSSASRSPRTARLAATCS